MSKEITGGTLIARSLAARGVRLVTTVPTPRLKPLLDAFKELESVQVVEARNETAAASIADGYIRCSRRRAAVLTDGCGRALAQMVGVTNAWADKIPLFSLALCDDRLPDYNKGLERYRFDQGAAFQPVTCRRLRLGELEKIPSEIKKAGRDASGGRMGPVHIEIPYSLLNRTVAAGADLLPPLDREADTTLEPARLAGNSTAIEKAVRLIKGARKPLLLCGSGVRASDAAPEVRKLIERYGLPAATTMAGMGCLPVSHPLSLGGPSYAAGEVFHVAIKEADVVIALGTSFGGLEGFGLPPLWSKKIAFIHVDIDPLQLGLNVIPAVSIRGDVKTVTAQLQQALAEDGFAGNPKWEPWRRFLGNLKRSRQKRLAKNAQIKTDNIHQGALCQQAGEIIAGDDTIMVIDGGNTPLYAAMYAPDVKPEQVVFPFGMAALGSGLAYAIGAQLAFPEKKVIVLTGDGSFLYNIQELETMRRLELPITILINNDSAWNMIRAMQDMFYARNFVGTDLAGVDYVLIAAGFGARAERINRLEELPAAYARASRYQGPAVIDCITDKANTPDSLVSFALVEFQGTLHHFSPLLFLKSMWLMKDGGIRRMTYLAGYIVKALLRINPGARRRKG
ncbi:MAG: thiamine pyrophosphate-binding protein [Firmicutes bacterium]|nr:thiamine pyrophosphate-binding protein [Bacillota bacterium]